MSFQLEELLRGAALLDDLVQQLLGIETETSRVKDELGLSLYDSYATGCDAINAVADSGKEIGRVRREFVEISRDVRSSHLAYEEAEAKNAKAGINGLDEMRFSGFMWPLGRDLMQDLITRFIPPEAGVKVAMHALVESSALPAFQPRHVNVRKMDETVEELEPSMAESLLRLERLHARNDGEIEIIELDQNGSSSWMVLIPGSQPMTPTSNPFDIAGVGEAMGYDSEAVVPAIGQALREAGAQAGDQVVAVGHSQGGVHAMNLAQNKAFLSEFDLKYVLTAGAPVGGISPEPGISSLHLEHAQDWVPGADGQINADTKDRVTVTLTDEVRTPQGEDPGLGPGHDQKNYAAGAGLVSASRDPSLVASTAVFASVVGAGGVAKVTRFKLERDPLPDRRGTIGDPGLPESRSVAGAR